MRSTEQLLNADYQAPISRTRSEIRVKGSRFLAIIEPVLTPNEAMQQIAKLRAEHSSATHLCWAWRLGREAQERCSDAGEPWGTAGKPLLSVLSGAAVSDALVGVARWFGGTKLGRGGLVRAYAEVARAALEECSLESRLPVVTVGLHASYGQWGAVERLVASLKGEMDAAFGEVVSAKVTVHAADSQELVARLADLGVLSVEEG